MGELEDIQHDPGNANPKGSPDQQYVDDVVKAARTYFPDDGTTTAGPPRVVRFGDMSWPLALFRATAVAVVFGGLLSGVAYSAGGRSLVVLGGFPLLVFAGSLVLLLIEKLWRRAGIPRRGALLLELVGLSILCGAAISAWAYFEQGEPFGSALRGGVLMMPVALGISLLRRLVGRR